MSVVVFAQTNSFQTAQKTLQERGEVYFKFSMAGDELMKKKVLQLSQIISIDEIIGDEVIAYANANGFSKFIEFNIDFEVLTPPSLVFKPSSENMEVTRNMNDWDYYPSYEEYIDMMNQFAVDFPTLCEVVNIGTTNDGRELLFIHINDDFGTSQDEPEFMYTATMHGDEVVGYVLTLRYIDYLLQNYGTNSEVTNLVNNIDIWINPLANPDGTYAMGNSSVWGATRTNAFNVDLNRNYADPEDGPHPDGNVYQIETLAFMELAEEHSFVMSSNMHGGAEVVNYPWDTWSQLAADDNWWIYVSREYADIVHENSPSGYLTDLDNGITNGYAWYSISGGRQDYMNYFHNCREMTLELSSSKMPSENQLPVFWESNYRSFNKYMEKCLYGFSGMVTNANNGNPMEAKVFVDNHDIENSWVYSDPSIGNYFRPIMEGTYDITFSAYGFHDNTINDVVITSESNYELNVELIPYTSLTAGFTSSSNIISTGSSVDFFDESWGEDIISWDWTFEGGEPSTSSAEDPEGIVYADAGSYDVSLTVTDIAGDSDTKFIEDFIIVTDSYNMTNGNITTCNALFFDTGGDDSDYNNDENLIMTFYPEMPSSSIKMEFIEFDVEKEDNCDYDYMEIFDGTDINAPLIGQWCGTEGPGSLIANNEDGALTVYFHSDYSVTESGWKAIVSCDSNVGIVQNEKYDISVFPNPASTEVQIIAKGSINNIKLTDMSGRVIYFMDTADGNHNVNTANFDRGMYLLSFTHKGNSFTRKIVLE